MTEPLLELNIRPATLPDEALLQVATVDQVKYTPESVEKAFLWILVFFNGIRGTFALHDLKARQANEGG